MDRNTFLRDKLSNFLQRLNPPKAMQSNAEAQKEEITDLYSRIIKLAPSREYTEWWKDFTEHLLSNAIARTWPTIRELKEAAKAIAPKRPEFIDETKHSWKLDEASINAKRINAMEPVGEYWITGKGAQELVRRGMVTSEQLEPYKYYLSYAKRSVDSY